MYKHVTANAWYGILLQWLGQPRYSHYNGSQSHLDLSLVCSTLGAKSYREVLDDTLGSDHSPTITRINVHLSQEIDDNDKFILSKADWKTFKDNSREGSLLCKDILIRSEICPKTEFETTPPIDGILFQVSISTRVSYVCEIVQNFRQMAAPNVPFTNPSSPFLSQSAKCRPWNTQNGRTKLSIANPTADSESGSPVSYSSFLLTISLIFWDICVWQTDRQTTQTINIAAPTLWRAS